MNDKWAFKNEPKIDILSFYEIIFRRCYEYGNGLEIAHSDDLFYFYGWRTFIYAYIT